MRRETNRLACGEDVGEGTCAQSIRGRFWHLRYWALAGSLALHSSALDRHCRLRVRMPATRLLPRKQLSWTRPSIIMLSSRDVTDICLRRHPVSPFPRLGPPACSSLGTRPKIRRQASPAAPTRSNIGRSHTSEKRCSDRFSMTLAPANLTPVELSACVEYIQLAGKCINGPAPRT